MDKKTQTLLGVGALAVVGYFIWKNQQPKKVANLVSSKSMLSPGCPCKKSSGQTFTMNGQTWELCAGVGSDGQPDKICRVVGGTSQSTVLTPNPKQFIGETKGRGFAGEKSGRFDARMQFAGEPMRNGRA